MRSLACSLLLLLTASGCGPWLEEPPETATAPIWNGTLTADYPAVGALTWDGDARCTVTLVAPDAVLTAAHCIQGLSPDDSAEMSVYFGPGSPGPLHGDHPVSDALPLTPLRFTPLRFTPCVSRS